MTLKQIKNRQIKAAKLLQKKGKELLKELDPTALKFIKEGIEAERNFIMEQTTATDHVKDYILKARDLIVFLKNLGWTDAAEDDFKAVLSLAQMLQQEDIRKELKRS